MHVYKKYDDEKHWPPPATRLSAIDDARYYMWMGCPMTAFSIIVALCASVDKKGSDKYDEALEQRYTTAYQRKQN